MAPNDTFKALADPTRREIIRILKTKSMAAGEIAEHFSITKPSISHHLNILKQADLVSDQRQGQNMVYSLNTSVFEEAMRMLMDFFNWKDDHWKEEYQKENDESRGDSDV